VYGIGRSLTRAIGFILIPVYTRFLTPVDYGYLELIGVAERILTIIVAQGMGTSFFRFYADAKNKDGLPTLVSTTQLYLSLSGLLTAAILFLGSGPFARFLFQDAPQGPIYIRLLGLNIALALILMTPYQVFRAQLQAGRTVRISLLGFLIQVLLTIYLVTVLRLGVLGVLTGQVVSALVLAVFTLWLIRGQLCWRLSLGRLKALQKFGIPLIFVGLARWVLELSDRFLIDRLAGTYDLGLYSLGSKFANIITFAIIGPFSVAWGAYCFQIAAGDNAKETFARIATYLLALLCMAGICIVVWGEIVIKIMAAESFWGSEVVLLPLVCTNILTGAVLILSFGMVWVKRTGLVSYIMTAGAILNVALNLVLIPKLGIQGAAWASMIAAGGIAAASYRMSQRLYSIPFETGRLLKITIPFLILAPLAVLFKFPSLPLDLVFRVALTGGFVAIIIGSRFLLPDETAYLRKAGAELRSWIFKKSRG
jgi:O-antigen/teichoic acid export membrane protein